MEESVAAFDVYKEVAVPNARAMERSRRMKTSNAADFLPLYGPWKGHEHCRVVLFGNNSLVSFDPFSKDHSNYNQIITGGSGSGKSFLTNVLLLQMLRENPKVFIIDIGGSYKKLCENLEGQYLPISLDSGISINPFDLVEGEVRPSNHKIKFLLGLIEIMTKEDFQAHLSRLERAQIEESIIGLYEKHKSPKLSFLREELLNSEDPNLIRIGKILSSWCGNTPFGQILDKETKISLSKNLISFDLKGLEVYPDLQSVFLYVITDLVWREVQKDKSTMKFLVLDECWKLLESSSGSVFIGEVFRTFRKYFASAIAISQNIDDFAKSSVSQAILPNSSIKWVLMQKGSDKKRLKEVLNLNDKEVEHITALKQERGLYSEAFLMSEDNHAVIRVCPTPLEYWIATTDPRDTAKIEVLKRNEPALSQLQILKKLADEYPYGVVGG
jgi:conjugal transfer ATP-binding protein TraC